MCNRSAKQAFETRDEVGVAEATDHTEGGDILGFIWMKHDDGRWKENFDPRLVGTWFTDNFYEASTWTYSLYVPQDTRELIGTVGGPAAFSKRLDLFFSESAIDMTSATSLASSPRISTTGSGNRATPRVLFAPSSTKAIARARQASPGMMILARWDPSMSSIDWDISQWQRRMCI